ncbi:substrate binding domain-containing protein [Archangium sp.]|uniref:substrate binding domain-containing protein n=1 Tax=Archangium sp. TaxID=1872627 RepID=UPI003899FF1B
MRARVPSAQSSKLVADAHGKGLRDAHLHPGLVRVRRHLDEVGELAPEHLGHPLDARPGPQEAFREGPALDDARGPQRVIVFRVGTPGDASLVAARVADATLVFVASPGYVSTRGAPGKPEDLAAHDCIALAPEGGPPRWAFPEGTGVRWVPVSPHIRVNHLGLAREAALRGLGITNLPYFACARALERGELVQVLAEHTVAFGGIYLVHPSRRLGTARVRAFRELALEVLKKRPELHAKPGRSAAPSESRGSSPPRRQARQRPSTPRDQVSRASVTPRAR